MNTETNEGKLPAFPFASDIYGHHGGMTLRDWFAGVALQAVPMSQSALHDHQAIYERIASHAYKMADAMLKERSK